MINERLIEVFNRLNDCRKVLGDDHRLLRKVLELSIDMVIYEDNKLNKMQFQKDMLKEDCEACGS
jgi:hypothetical protein